MLKMISTMLGLAFAVVWDLKQRRIPNWIFLFFLASGLILNLVELGFSGFSQLVAGFILGLALLFVPFAMGGMGAGDVKLLAGIGALWGAKFVFAAALLGAVAGGVVALLYLLPELLKPVIRERNLLFALIVPKVRLKELTKRRFPYAIAIALGTLGAYFWMFSTLRG